MQLVRFLKFFEIQQSSFFILLSFLDIIVFSINLVINYININDKNINMLLTSMVFVDSIMLMLAFSNLLYFLIKKKFIFMINIFYLWTRFIIYCFYFIFSIVLLSSSLYKIYFDFEDNKNMNYLYISGIGVMIPYCLFNIMWCFALKKIMENEDFINENKSDYESYSYNSDNITVSEF